MFSFEKKTHQKLKREKKLLEHIMLKSFIKTSKIQNIGNSTSSLGMQEKEID